MQRTDRGQSETIGSILLVAIVVLTVSVFGAYALGQLGDGEKPRVEIQSNISTNELSLTHAGGDSLHGDELAVIIRWNGNETRLGFASQGSYDTDNGGLFEAGETWTLNNPPYDQHDTATVYLVHVPSGSVIYRGARTVTKPTPTPTPAPGVSTPPGLGRPAPGRAPTADFDWTPNFPESGETVNFQEQADDNDGHITSYEWTFGDGATATGPSPNHTYANNGTYDVTLTVTDDNGNTASETKTITIGNQPPTADFSYGPRKPKVGEQVNFTENATDPDGTIQSYYWKFGDGNTSTQANPTHTYSSKGRYNVTLTVTDNDGETDTYSETVRIKPARGN